MHLLMKSLFASVFFLRDHSDALQRNPNLIDALTECVNAQMQILH